MIFHIRNSKVNFNAYLTVRLLGITSYSRTKALRTGGWEQYGQSVDTFHPFFSIPPPPPQRFHKNQRHSFVLNHGMNWKVTFSSLGKFRDGLSSDKMFVRGRKLCKNQILDLTRIFHIKQALESSRVFPIFWSVHTVGDFQILEVKFSRKIDKRRSAAAWPLWTYLSLPSTVDTETIKRNFSTLTLNFLTQDNNMSYQFAAAGNGANWTQSGFSFFTF